MRSDPIYKRDSTGKIRVWSYEVSGNQWRTHTGLLDGKTVTSGWTVCTPKSQPTAEAQALFEAKAEEAKKLERDYHRSIDDIDTPNYFKPMLAKKYEGKLDEIVWSQPKLDGIRCIATAQGLFTRQGKRILGVPHIEEALAPYFDFDPTLMFDGELYNHKLRDDFNRIASIVRKQKPTDAQIEEASKIIEYHIYDLPSAGELPFVKRWSRLCNLDPMLWDQPMIEVVMTKAVTSTEALDHLYSEYLRDGYEGQMIRLDGPYEQKRSSMLLKRKEFQDAEFTIVAIEEGLGNWAGYAKRVVCRLPDGREFGAGVKGTQEFTKQLLLDRDRYIGQQATVRFFEYTPDGVPRFPVAVDFGRDD